MVARINDIESDLNDLDELSILQTEDGNTSDITINNRSDVSCVGTIIYYQNLRNDGDNRANPPWKTCQHSTVTNSKAPHLELLLYCLQRLQS